MRRRGPPLAAAGRRFLCLAAALAGMAGAAAPASAAGIVVNGSAAVNSAGADYVLQNDPSSGLPVTYVDVFAPAGTNFTSAGGSQGSCSSTGAHITCTGVNLAPGAQMTIHGAASGLHAGDSHQLCGSNGSSGNCTTVAATAESPPSSCPAGQTGTPPNCRPGASRCNCTQLNAGLKGFEATTGAIRFGFAWVLECAAGTGSSCHALIETTLPAGGFRFAHPRGRAVTVSRTVATAHCDGTCNGRTVFGRTQQLTIVPDKAPLRLPFTLEFTVRLICLRADGSEGRVITVSYRYSSRTGVLVAKFPGGRTISRNVGRPGTRTRKKPHPKPKPKSGNCRCVRVRLRLDPTVPNRKALRPDKHAFGVGFTWRMKCRQTGSPGAVKGSCNATLDFLPPEVLAGGQPSRTLNLRLNLRSAHIVCTSPRCTLAQGRFQIKMRSRDQLNKLFGRTLAFKVRTSCFGVVKVRTVTVLIDRSGVLRPPPPG